MYNMGYFNSCTIPVSTDTTTTFTHIKPSDRGFKINLRGIKLHILNNEKWNISHYIQTENLMLHESIWRIFPKRVHKWLDLVKTYWWFWAWYQHTYKPSIWCAICEWIYPFHDYLVTFCPVSFLIESFLLFLHKPSMQHQSISMAVSHKISRQDRNSKYIHCV